MNLPPSSESSDSEPESPRSKHPRPQSPTKPISEANSQSNDEIKTKADNFDFVHHADEMLIDDSLFFMADSSAELSRAQSDNENDKSDTHDDHRPETRAEQSSDTEKRPDPVEELVRYARTPTPIASDEGNSSENEDAPGSPIMEDAPPAPPNPRKTALEELTDKVRILKMKLERGREWGQTDTDTVHDKMDSVLASLTRQLTHISHDDIRECMIYQLATKNDI